jgi:colicin import membrane protein
MQARASDRWISIGLSVLLHAALLGALVYGWLLFRRPPRPAPTLAIEATVVDARTVQGLTGAAPPPQPPPPPVEPEGPPQPSAEELAQREAARAQQEAEAEQQRQAAAEQAAQAKQLEEQRAAEEQRKADAERKAQEAALAQQHAADAAEESEREADLKRSLAAEEHAQRAGPALASWQAQIAAKINRAWLRPPTARPGIECVLNVTQVPGGEVTQVSIGDCNGDQAVRESIEAAVYRASPLPPPPDPTLFERNLKINFKPD